MEGEKWRQEDGRQEDGRRGDLPGGVLFGMAATTG
jgi:hypothetical protein